MQLNRVVVGLLTLAPIKLVQSYPATFSHNGLDVWTIPEHNSSTGFAVYPVIVLFIVLCQDPSHNGNTEVLKPKCCKINFPVFNN